VAAGERALDATGLTELELEAWGRRIGEEAERPLILALRGALGAGKSVLARAVARGAGVAGSMPSPTFNLVYRYEPDAGGVVYHLDLYRLEDAEEVWELGWREIGEGDQIVMIEWPERAEHLLPEPRWDVELAMEADATRRTIVARPVSAPPALPAPRDA
jgi:tRNA threonylcarbamoyladenosine biosynthesis protein TsaE